MGIRLSCVSSSIRVLWKRLETMERPIFQPLCIRKTAISVWNSSVMMEMLRLISWRFMIWSPCIPASQALNRKHRSYICQHRGKHRFIRNSVLIPTCIRIWKAVMSFGHLIRDYSWWKKKREVSLFPAVRREPIKSKPVHRVWKGKWKSNYSHPALLPIFRIGIWMEESGRKLQMGWLAPIPAVTAFWFMIPGSSKTNRLSTKQICIFWKVRLQVSYSVSAIETIRQLTGFVQT